MSGVLYNSKSCSNWINLYTNGNGVTLFIMATMRSFNDVVLHKLQPLWDSTTFSRILNWYNVHLHEFKYLTQYRSLQIKLNSNCKQYVLHCRWLAPSRYSWQIKVCHESQFLIIIDFDQKWFGRDIRWHLRLVLSLRI